MRISYKTAEMINEKAIRELRENIIGFDKNITEEYLSCDEYTIFDVYHGKLQVTLQLNLLIELIWIEECATWGALYIDS